MINGNANKKEFLDILDKKILVSDGSMGATLMASGFSVLPDSLNLDSTQIKEIIDIHLGYLKAGSDIIITNTLNSTPTKLEFHGLRNKIKEINENAVSAVNEALIAIKAIRKISEVIPIACSLTFGENGVTLMGNKAEDVVNVLIDAGSEIVGANCSVGSGAMLNVVT